jgi:hypothetical protein
MQPATFDGLFLNGPDLEPTLKLTYGRDVPIFQGLEITVTAASVPHDHTSGLLIRMWGCGAAP